MRWTQIQHRHAHRALACDVAEHDAEQLHEALLTIFGHLLDHTFDNRLNWGDIALLAHDLFQLDHYHGLRALDALIRFGADETLVETTVVALLDRLARVQPYSPLYLPQSSSTVK